MDHEFYEEKSLELQEDESLELHENESSEDNESVVLDASSLFDENDEADLDQLENALDAAFDKFKSVPKNLVGDEYPELDDAPDREKILMSFLLKLLKVGKKMSVVKREVTRFYNYFDN